MIKVTYWKDLCKKAAAQKLQVFYLYKVQCLPHEALHKDAGIALRALWTRKGGSLLGNILKSFFCNQTEHWWRLRSSLHPSKTAIVVWVWWLKPTDKNFQPSQLLQTLTAQSSPKWRHLVLYSMSCLVSSCCCGKAGDPLCQSHLNVLQTLLGCMWWHWVTVCEQLFHSLKGFYCAEGQLRTFRNTYRAFSVSLDILVLTGWSSNKSLALFPANRFIQNLLNAVNSRIHI